MDPPSAQKDISDHEPSCASSDVAKAPHGNGDDTKYENPSGLAAATVGDDPEVLRVTQCVDSVLGALNADAAATTESTYAVSSFVKEPKSNTTQCAMKGVPALSPPKRMGIDEVFDERSGLPMPEVLKAHLLKEGLLNIDAALKIIDDGAAILRREKNVVRMKAPVIVCGDVHGQFFDLPTLFELGGKPCEINYLFLGDYVDHGRFGIEVVLYLLALKLNYPETFFLLRGNHECRRLTRKYMFKRECEGKYATQVYEACLSAFDCLPLAAVVNGQLFCVHGGLSPKICTLEDVELIVRFREPPSSGPMCDLLWSDPREDYDDETSTPEDFIRNEARGCSYRYSYDAVRSFLDANELLSVVRAHEVQDDGFKIYRYAKNGFPPLITIFSAPNYRNIYRNKASVLRYDNNVFKFKQYLGNLQHYWLRNSMNGSDRSLPFLAEKEPKMRREVVCNKGLVVGEVAKAFNNLREQRESLLELKGLVQGGSAWRLGALPSKDSLKTAQRSGNECMPREDIDRSPEEKEVQKLSASSCKRSEALVHDGSLSSSATPSMTSQNQSRENPRSPQNFVVLVPSLPEIKKLSSPSTSAKKDKPTVVSPKSVIKQLSSDVGPTSGRVRRGRI